MIFIKRQMTRTIIIKCPKISFTQKKKAKKNVAFLNESLVYVQQSSN